MKNLEIDEIELVELNSKEMTETVGGSFLVGLFIGAILGWMIFN